MTRINSIKSAAGAATQPIAIIGMSLRFSGDATNPEKLWRMISEARDAWSPIPETRFNNEAFYEAEYSGRTGVSKVKGGYFMTEHPSKFDANFFNFTRDMASELDPQIRMLLESSFESFENAGIPIEKVAGSDTAVYMGTFSKDYHDLLYKDPDTLPRSVITATGIAMLSNRLSHFFDLRGASMTVDTGCSSSFAALHGAVQSIRSGESKMALVGGASLLLNPDPFIGISLMGVVGADGKCFAWDSRANGFGRGEGIATLLLKPLKDAIRDGDPVQAVIRETAINQDGKTPTITAPSAEAQEECIRACYTRAGLDPSETCYVEAHMTGTQTGDPIEARAISNVFATPGRRDRVFVGSIKTNLGHLEAASGIAGLLKCVMMLKHGYIAPNLNFEKPNPDIDMAALGVDVPLTLTPWPKGMPRRVSINNYGYGGTNGHVILDGPDEYFPTQQASSTCAKVSKNTKEQPRRLLVLSSRDSGITKTMLVNLNTYLQQKKADEQSIHLDNLAYTLSERRCHFPWRLAISTSNPSEELAELLQPKPDDEASRKTFQQSTTPSIARDRPRLGFVFNGQGAQWHAMGRSLFTSYPVFSSSLQKADDVMKKLGADWSLQTELLECDEKSSRVGEPKLSQPVCVALQMCLVDLLRSFGIEPSAVTSHSSGEIAAAYATGLLNFEEAVGVAYFRGALTDKYNAKATVLGGMLAVGLGAKDARRYLETHGFEGMLVVACENSPSSVTISGDLDAIERLEGNLKEDEGTFARKLKVKSAYHSHHMRPMAAEYLSALTKLLLGSNKKQPNKSVVYSSPVTGGVVDDVASIGPQHWVDNLLSPVRFNTAFERMCAMADVDMVVEIGPHSALAGPIRQIVSAHPELCKQNQKQLPYVSLLVRSQDATLTTQNAVGMLWSKGYPVNLAAVNHFGDEKANVQQLQVVSDLPSYPWNHNSSYWYESRLSVAIRQRKHFPHPLLGVSLGTTPIPTWRHFLRVADLPWLRDHMVQGDMVFPGAGGIAMAIEALKQLRGDQKEPGEILGYWLRDVQITNALVVPDTNEGVEVQLTLCRCNDNKALEPGWYEFRLKSPPSSMEEMWTEHSSGYIFAKNKTVPAVAVVEPTVDNAQVAAVKCNGQVNGDKNKEQVDHLFATLRSMGLQHGPTFQNLLRLFPEPSNSSATFDFRIGDAASEKPPFLLHPTTLDSIFQGAFATLPSGSYKKTMVLPRSIGEIYVSDAILTSPGSNLTAEAVLARKDQAGFQTTITTFSDSPRGEQVLEVKDLFCQAVGRGSTDEDQPPKLLFKQLWHPDPNFIPREEVEKPLQFMLGDVDFEEISVNRKLVRATWYFIDDALAQLDEAIAGVDDGYQDMEWHHKILLDWMKTQHAAGLAGILAKGSASWARTSKGMRRQFVDELAGSDNVNAQMLCRVGNNLVDILRGRAAPLSVMTEGGLLTRWYATAMRLGRSYAQVKSLVRSFADKNPRAKVLEIGGGTAGCTVSVLQGLSDDTPDGQWRFADYTFTDISMGFFEAATKKLDRWASCGRVNFKKLDIEQSPIDQGFDLGSYDLIIACQVLHATKDMNRTMTHVHSLLKKGGKLVMVETTQDTPDVQLIFGTLPGWWLAIEPERKSSPNLKLEHWQRVLKTTGFSGTDIELRDVDDQENYSFTVMMTTALGPTIYPDQVSVVLPPKQTEVEAVPKAFIDKLQSLLHTSTGAKSVVVETLTSAANNAEGRVFVFLAEVMSPLLRTISKAQFEQVQKLLTQARGALWVSRGSFIDGKGNPDMAMHLGLLRTLRMEDAGRRYVSVDLDCSSSDPWTTSNTQHIANAFKDSFDLDRNHADVDTEYAVHNSLLHISRVYDDTKENWSLHLINQPAATASAISTLSSTTQLQLQPWSSLGPDSRMEVGIPGTLDSLLFRDVPRGDLPPNEIEIDPRAFGLNFRDVLIALGQMNETQLGYECSGVITAMGDEAAASSGYKVGDRVCGWFRGHWAKRLRMAWQGAVPIPAGLGFEDAASLSLIWATSYYCLCEVARLEKGESVLIHSASGGVGQSSIMLAQALGATIYATVGTEAKAEFLVKEYGIPRSHIFSSHDVSFKSGVMATTNGKGVDVVLNSLAGPLLRASWECVARFGRFVEIGKKDLLEGHLLDMGPMARGVSFSAVDLQQTGNYNAAVLQRTLRAVMRLYDEGIARPVKPITIFGINEIDKALRLMQAGKHMGKMLIVPQPTDLVKVGPSTPAPVRLSPKSSYLIAGGMGGIGQSLARRIVSELGCKNLVIISRNAESSKDTARLVADLEKQHCHVVVKNCDISDSADFECALTHCRARGLPPIKGVIQGAMVLDDSIFPNMKYSQWQAATRPKVDATWNIHNALPDLDFMVLLSSMTGFRGNTSQANYSAGGTFQDAFARFRGSHGLSIDLASVQNVGWVAGHQDHAEVAERLLRSGMAEISEAQTHGIIEAAMRRCTVPEMTETDEAHMITGIAEFGPGTENTTSMSINDRRFSSLLRMGDSSASGRRREEAGDDDKQNAAARLSTRLQSVPTTEQAVPLILDAIVAKLANMFDLDASEMDAKYSVRHYGVDSLIAVELRNWLVSNAGAEATSIFDVMHSPSLSALAAKVGEKSRFIATARV